MGEWKETFQAMAISLPVTFIFAIINYYNVVKQDISSPGSLIMLMWEAPALFIFLTIIFDTIIRILKGRNLHNY